MDFSCLIPIRGEKLRRKETCGVNGCRYTHNRLLQEGKTVAAAVTSLPQHLPQPSRTPFIQKAETQMTEFVSVPPMPRASLIREGESRAMTTTMATDSDQN